MQRVSHSLAFLSLLGAVLSGSVGCADFTASVDLVIELGTVDLDARREALEAAVCASPTGENCAVLCALSDCGFDPAVGPTGELPRLPPEFPGQVDVAALTARVDCRTGLGVCRMAVSAAEALGTCKISTPAPSSRPGRSAWMTSPWGTWTPPCLPTPPPSTRPPWSPPSTR